MPGLRLPRLALPLPWLILAACLSYAASVNDPVSLAAWLWPVFLLRFTRESHAVTGFVLSLAFLSPTSYFAVRDMWPLPLAIMMTVILSGTALSLLPFVADRLLYSKLPPVAASLVLPAGVVTAEFFQVWLGGGVTWGSTAYTQQGLTPLLQIVSLTGMWGLIFVLHWLAPVANAIWDRRSKSQAATRPLLVFFAAIAAVWLYGEARVKLAPIAATVRVAGVAPPPNLDWLLDQQIPPVMEPEQLRANRAQYRPASFTLQDRLFEITESEALAGARVVVWSEMAAWVFTEDEPALQARATDAAKRLGIDLLISVATIRPDAEKRVENKTILFRPDGSSPVSYRKTHLIPGTEEELTLPGDGKAKVTHTSAGRLASAICFDLDYPATIRQMANSGIDVLAGPSHDFQSVRDIHARMAVLRAIENGVALMRPTANGVGIATDAYGRTLSSVGYLRSGGATLVAHLPVHGVRTLYSRWGDWFAWVCVLGTFALAAAPTVSVFPKRVGS